MSDFISISNGNTVVEGDKKNPFFHTPPILTFIPSQYSWPTHRCRCALIQFPRIFMQSDATNNSDHFGVSLSLFIYFFITTLSFSFLLLFFIPAVYFYTGIRTIISSLSSPLSLSLSTCPFWTRRFRLW